MMGKVCPYDVFMVFLCQLKGPLLFLYSSRFHQALKALCPFLRTWLKNWGSGLISYYINDTLWGIITHPCSTFDDSPRTLCICGGLANAILWRHSYIGWKYFPHYRHLVKSWLPFTAGFTSQSVNREKRWFSFCVYTVLLPVIWDAMTVGWRDCNQDWWSKWSLLTHFVNVCGLLYMGGL